MDKKYPKGVSRDPPSEPDLRAQDTIVPDLAALGAFVRRRRRELGLTDAGAAADRLGVSRRLLLELEQGARGVGAGHLLRLLQTLGCDLVIRRRDKNVPGDA